MTRGPQCSAIFPPGYMGATVSGPSITVDETGETITLTAGATIPTSFLRVFGCETMTDSSIRNEGDNVQKIQ